MTSTGDGEHDLGRMPCTNTGDFAETLVSFPGELLGTPSVSDTLEAVTLGDCNDIDTLVLLEDGGDINRLFKKTMRKFDLVSDGTTVDLDLHKMCLLLTETGLADLGVCENTDDGAVFADTLEFTGS